jgi:hypothetical protein
MSFQQNAAAALADDTGSRSQDRKPPAVQLLVSSVGARVEERTYDGGRQHACLRDHLPVVEALLIGGANILAANNEGHLPIHAAVSREKRSAVVTKYLLQHFYTTTRRLRLHELLGDLTWIGNPKLSVGVPTLHAALHQKVLGTDDVVDIVGYLFDKTPAWLYSRDEGGSLPLHAACRRGVSFKIMKSLVNHDKASFKSMTSKGELPLFLACEMPETSLDTIFLLMKLYPLQMIRMRWEGLC